MSPSSSRFTHAVSPLVVLAVLWSSAVHAQQPAAVEPSPSPTPEVKPAAEKPKQDEAPTITLAPGKGLSIKTADGKFAFGIRSRMQLRESYTHVQATHANTNEVQVRTLRLSLFGHALDPDLRYNIQLAFGGGDFDSLNPSPIFDAFVEYTRWRDLQIRVGQFFVPFDRARTIREFALQFVDRQQVVRELTLDRDVGVMFSSNNLFGLSEVLGYNLFLGGGDGRNRFNAVHAGPIAVLRLTARPFGLFDDDQEGDLSRERRPRLAIGAAAGYNQSTNRPGSTTGAPYATGIVNYRHAAADLVFKYAGLSILAETVVRRADRDFIEGSVNGSTLREWTRSGYGYFVQAGMMVTSKLELTGRWERLYARHGTDPKLIELAELQGKQVAAGANLYLNGHAFKLQADYVRILGNNGTQRQLGRLQLDATF